MLGQYSLASTSSTMRVCGSPSRAGAASPDDHTLRHSAARKLSASHLLDDRYVVRLGDRPSCECTDASFRHVFCKHQVAASIAASKSRTCDCCGNRVSGKALTEVTEDDELLSWYPGEELCERCIRAGYWS